MIRPRMTVRHLLALLLLTELAGYARSCASQANGHLVQTFTVDARSFRTDFRTLYECVERVGRKRDLRLQYSGAGTGWDGGDLANQNETYLVEASKEQLPFLADGPMLPIATLRGPNGQNAPIRKIKLDPDTGKLGAPEGVDLK